MIRNSFNNSFNITPDNDSKKKIKKKKEHWTSTLGDNGKGDSKIIDSIPVDSVPDSESAALLQVLWPQTDSGLRPIHFLASGCFWPY